MIPMSGATVQGLRHEVYRRTYRYVGIAIAALLVLAALHYATESRSKRSTIEASERLNTELGRVTIVKSLEGVISDLLYLADRQQRLGGYSAVTGAKAFSDDLLAFASHQRVYDQVRFIDLLGRERIRVNYRDGVARAVPGEELQDKSDRYYVSETLQFGPGQVYVSPFDLNIERGVVEIPAKPVIRFATPVFNPRGKRVGILILNYLGALLLDAFRDSSANIADHVQLLNADGYWLASTVHGNEWGFMRGREEHFGTRYPTIWKKVREAERGQFEADGFIVTFTTVRPLEGSPTDAGGTGTVAYNTWKIVSQLPLDALQSSPGTFFERYSILYLLMLLLLIAVSVLLGQEITKGREATERAALLSRAIEQSPATVMITDARGAIEYVNPKFTELTGYEFAEVRGLNPRFLKSGHTFDADYAQLWETVSEGGEWRGTLCNRKKNGDLYWEDAVISGVRNIDGEIANFIAVKADITERRRLQERFRHCVEAAPYTMILTDHGGRIALVNQMAEEMFGYPREALLGKPVEMLIPADQRGTHVRDRREFVTTGSSRNMGIGREVVGLHRDGSIFPVEIGLHTFDTEEGRMSLAAVTNVSLRKRLEAEIAWRDRQLAQSDALVAVGRMANMVAHDIRNPLSSIKMGLQIISKRDCVRRDAEARELNSIALEQVGFVEEVVEDLMTYSRESELNPRWLDLRQVLATALSGAKRRFEERGVRLITDFQEDLPALRCDRTRLRRTFSNLILNALDATDSLTDRAPEISIAVRMFGAEKQQVRIDICDNAGGIAAADLERIFEPFFTTREQGTGLGLAISKRIVEQHGGTLEIARGERWGTRATVLLPIDSAAATAPMIATPRAVAANADPAGMRTEDMVS